ncbi:MAG: YfiH family protein [Halieaceae bacterium]|jgi:YfiH family protein
MGLRRVHLPDWPENIGVYQSTRRAGYSSAPWDTFNLGDQVGDDPAHVQANRAHLQELLPPHRGIAWLRQVHGTRVVSAGEAVEGPCSADGCWTAESGLVCAVMTADCLPVVLTDRGGKRVAALHAGWRGLAAGVLVEGVRALGVDPQGLLAWLGPCIGADAYEVGPEVRAGLADLDKVAISPRGFRPSPGRPGHFLADLRALARAQLLGLGLKSVSASDDCTFAAPAEFYSFRRNAVTGRMATLVLRCPTP